MLLWGGFFTLMLQRLKQEERSSPAVTIPAVVAIAAPNDCKSVTHIHAHHVPPLIVAIAALVRNEKKKKESKYNRSKEIKTSHFSQVWGRWGELRVTLIEGRHEVSEASGERFTSMDYFQDFLHLWVREPWCVWGSSGEDVEPSRGDEPERSSSSGRQR